MEVEKFLSGKNFGERGDFPASHARGFGHISHDTERAVDLNEQLVRNKPATFFLRVTGNSMSGACIFEGDILVVDRSLKPQSGKIVIAVVDGEMLLRRLEKTMNKLRLVPETPKLSAMEITEYHDMLIWGVVTYVIRNL